MAEIKAGLDDTYFAWSNPTNDYGIKFTGAL
jgi:hypothetical protein